MKYGNARLFKFKRFIASFILALFVSQVSAPALPWAGVKPAEADSVLDLRERALRKADVGLDDVDSTSTLRKSNVLFLVESTATMAFSPKGVMPTVVLNRMGGDTWKGDYGRTHGNEQWWGVRDWTEREGEAGNWGNTARYYGLRQEDIVRMMRHATYGMGGLPVAFYKQNIDRTERNLYGRDIDEDNNWKGDQGSLEANMEFYRNSYYFPFTKAGDPLKDAYSGQETKLQSHFDNAPNWRADEADGNKLDAIIPYRDGDAVSFDYRYDNIDDVAHPYALVFKNPAWWASGPPAGATVTSYDLVPNDSRMYQAKLVLWRLLSDPALFQNLRVGLATTFLNPVNFDYEYNQNDHTGVVDAYDINGIFRVAPYGSNLYFRTVYAPDEAPLTAKYTSVDRYSYYLTWPYQYHYYDATGYPLGHDRSADNYTVAQPLMTRVGWNPTDDTPATYSHRTSSDSSWLPNSLAGSKKLRYENGIMTEAITGQVRVTTRLHGQYLPVWASQTNEPLYGMAEKAVGVGDADGVDYQKSLTVYRLLNRGSLHVPIRDYDAVWTRGAGANKVEINHADKMRLWVNGLSDIANWGPNQGKGESDRTGKQFHLYNDPEIGIAGVFSLPSAIFPDSSNRKPGLDRHYLMAPTSPDPILTAEFKGDTYLEGGVWSDFEKNHKVKYLKDRTPEDYAGSKKYIVHSHKSAYSKYVWNVRASSTEYEGLEFILNSQFIAGSGEATGSVIDFFSPYGVGNRAELADVSYPMRNTCEDNWVIVVASGVELREAAEKEYGGEVGAYSYHAWEAIKNLYDHTKNNKVNILVRNAAGEPVDESGKKVDPDSDSRYILRAKLDNPIRTLVIGLAPSEESMKGESAEIRAEVARVRENLNKMARAGQGKLLTDTSVSAYFADDVETLQNAIEDALRFIADNQAQPSKGAILESPSLGDPGDSAFNLYSSTFRIRGDDQWEGNLIRFGVTGEEIGSYGLTKMWELSDKVLEKRTTSPLTTNRNLRYWDGAALTGLTDDSYFQGSTGMTPGLMKVNANSNFPISAFSTSPQPHYAMFQWFKGYDFSYENSLNNGQSNLQRSSMLSDIGQGALAFVDDPAVANTLPGYQKWASDISANNPKKPNIYIQTNDGILHVADAASGDEKLAIVPPPVLVPSRVASFKSRHLSDGKYEWLDVLTEESEVNSRDAVRTRSIPVYTLDGALQKRAFSNATGSDWHMRLLAGLGRGGSGLYMMDVDDRDNPRLMWYKERIGEDLWEIVKNGGNPLPSRPMRAGSPDPAFMKLGFNSPKAAMGVTGTTDTMKNFIALAGGMQNSINLGKNGGEGAVLLMLDPETGALLTSFGAADVGNRAEIGTEEPSLSPAMGMMVSEPALLRTLGNSPYLAGSVYAADNRGTIFKVDMEGTDSSGNVSRLEPESWTINAVATLHKDAAAAQNSSDSYAIPFGVQVARDGGGTTWVAGGTNNLRTRIDGANPSGLLRNKSQMIFAFGTKSKHAIYGTDNLKTIAADDADDALSGTDNKDGWRIALRATDAGLGEEYVSAKPLLLNGVLYVATFREETVNWTSQSLCSLGVRASGTARLFAMDLTNSRGQWSGGAKYVELRNVKIVGLSASENSENILINSEALTDEADFSNLENEGWQRLHADGIDVTIGRAFGGGKINLDKGQNVVQYWLNNAN